MLARNASIFIQLFAFQVSVILSQSEYILLPMKYLTYETIDIVAFNKFLLERLDSYLDEIVTVRTHILFSHIFHEKKYHYFLLSVFDFVKQL